MKMTKILTVQMQKPELNILDALSLMDATVKSLERIRNSESEMNSQVQASVQFAKSFGLDAQKRTRRTSSRIDENPHTTADIQFYAQYRKSMIEVLDSLIYKKLLRKDKAFGSSSSASNCGTYPSVSRSCDSTISTIHHRRP